MTEADFYCFHDLTLEVRRSPRAEDRLSGLFEGLSWIKTTHFERRPQLRLRVFNDGNKPRVPSTAHECFRAGGLYGFDANSDYYLTDGSSVFHLQSGHGRGNAYLARPFLRKPALVQQNFWSFGLLKLLRAKGLYSLHAAGVTNKDRGLLVIGRSGSGKSTLAIGLIRAGWDYLSDDAVLLRGSAQGVEALALRKPFYVDAERSADYADFSLGEEIPDSDGGKRRRVFIERLYCDQQVSRCVPRFLIFSHITSQDQSELVPMDRVRALKVLLAESAPQLFDTNTMARHLEVLKKLLQQTIAYELKAGIDLYRAPTKLVRLLEKAEKGRRWCGSSSN